MYSLRHHLSVVNSSHLIAPSFTWSTDSIEFIGRTMDGEGVNFAKPKCLDVPFYCVMHVC